MKDLSIAARITQSGLRGRKSCERSLACARDDNTQGEYAKALKGKRRFNDTHCAGEYSEMSPIRLALLAPALRGATADRQGRLSIWLRRRCKSDATSRCRSIGGRPLSLRRHVQRSLVFRLLVILDQPEAPADERGEVLGLLLLLVEEPLDFRLELGLLMSGIQDLENLHGE